MSRQVRVVCQWNHDGNTAYDGKSHLGTQCPSCGNPIQGSAMTTIVTLADPHIEALIALGKAYAAERAAYWACPRVVGKEVWAAYRACRTETESAEAALRAMENE